MTDKPSFDQALLDRIRAAVPIAPMIAKHTTLERAGREQKGCCPFHNEKTPSFYVYAQHYHCFGCGAHGDIFTFAMDKEKYTFPEAVRNLASMAGIVIEETRRPDGQPSGPTRKRLKEALEAAEKYYAAALRTAESLPAQQYAVSRGITAEDATVFGLGYAPKGSLLTAHLRSNGFTDDEILGAGLAKRSNDGRGLLDFFYGRLMFPIRDRSGNVISFSGRILGPDTNAPKYINGPETLVFKKGRTLYGLDAALKQKALKEIVFVEGQIDVIAMHRVGFVGAAAPLGTAVTPEHLDEAWRQVDRLVGLFDGDRAGLAAAEKISRMAISRARPGKTLSIGLLPSTEDPDSLIKAGPDGIDTIRRLIAEAEGPETFLWQRVIDGKDVKDPSDRAQIREALAEIIKSIEHPLMAAEYGEKFNEILAQEFYQVETGRTLPRKLALVMVGMLIRTPDLLRDYEDVVRSIRMDEDLRAIRDILVDWHATNSRRPGEKLADAIRRSGLVDVVRESLKQGDNYAGIHAKANTASSPAEHAAKAFRSYISRVVVPQSAPSQVTVAAPSA